MAALTLQIDDNDKSPIAGRKGGLASIFHQAGDSGRDVSPVSEIPISIGPGQSHTIEGLSPGKYLIQLQYPSGVMETKSVKVRADHDLEVVFGTKVEVPDHPKDDVALPIERGQLPIIFGGSQGDIQITPELIKNLKKIKGVGPAVAKALTERGISSIAEVARLSDRDLDWLGQSAKSIRGTIGRFEIAKDAGALLGTGAGGIVRSASSPGGSLAPGVMGVGFAGPVSNFRPGNRGVSAGVPQSDDTVLSSLEPDIWADIETSPPTTTSEFDAAFLLLGAKARNEKTWKQLQHLLQEAKGAEDTAILATEFFDEHDERSARKGLTEVSEEAHLAAAQLNQTDFGRLTGASSELRPVAFVDDGYTSWLAFLPFPWVNLAHDQKSDLSVLANRGSKVTTSIDIKPIDPAHSNLLEFLQSGDNRATTAILEQANQALFEKFQNPLAAVAGGLALIHAKRWSANKEKAAEDFLARRNWEEWIGNLARSFSWIPDGLVLWAWLDLLKPESDRETAREKLLAAMDRGIPFYSGCFKLLYDGLRAVRADHPEAEEALNILERVSLRIDMRQVFTTIRLSALP